MGHGMPTTGEVIVLDDRARPVSSMEKMAAHVAPGVPHLAFSVMLQRQDGSVLLQRRAATKHHFAGYWSNSCCSHPAPDESVRGAAVRRVREELGIAINSTALQVMGAFWYRAFDSVSGLVEHEYDVVMLGPASQVPEPDPDEVDSVHWVSVTDLTNATNLPEGPLTPWLRRVTETAFGSADGPVEPGIVL